jgi:4-diphosphocytidyl-2-C-methyl-D-erythritol kinase
MEDDLTIQQGRPPVESIEGGLRVHAPAKVNLNLLVGPRRPDGFHEIDSYVAKVTLYDQVDLVPREDGRITFACEGPGCGPDAENLALRAAHALADAAARAGNGPRGADIRLTKRIPPGGGLGGGSSDAAAVLRGLAKLRGLDLSAAALGRLAAALGSDVPLFLGPPAVRMTGRGEGLAPLDLRPFLAVLFLPGAPCATREVYRAFDDGPAEARCPADRQLLPELLGGSPPSAWRDRLVNDLAIPAERLCPEMADRRRRLAEALAMPVCVTGSGSALFALCDDPAEAARVWGALPPDVRPSSLVVRPNLW